MSVTETIHLSGWSSDQSGTPWLRSIIALLLGLMLTGPAAAQNNTNGEKGASSSQRAIAYYADAAGYQNNGAYQLAVEEWQKLLKEFPRDPLASKAWHYLGVCNIQLDEPNYTEAIKAFGEALKDKQLESREETLINLSWCLFTRARMEPSGSASQRAGLEQAKQSLTEFLGSYGEGDHVDQALFYLGEIEYALGNGKKAIAYYNKLLGSRSLSQSSLRPDAQYAVAVAYEERNENSQATRAYRQFLNEHADHRLASEVRVRLADLLLKDNKPNEAERLLAGLTGGNEASMADYALLRLGYAFSLQGKNDQATAQYLSLLKRFPNSKHAPTAALSVGQALFQSGQYDEAIAQFRKLLDARDDQAADAAHWMAITLLRQNKPQDAIALLEDALKWAQKSPSGVSLQMDYADALYAIPEQLDKARQAYELIATEHPDDPLAPRAAYNAAFAALQSSRLSEARRWAETFLKRYPRDPLRGDVAYVAAEALLQQGEHDAAVKAYGKLISAAPQNPARSLWTLRLAMAHYLAGQYGSAIDLLGREMGRFRENVQKAEAQFILGASYLYEENMQSAIKQLTASHEASDRWTSADEVLLLLAEAYQRNQDNESARKTLESLLKKYPNSRLKAQVDYKLAQLSAAMNQYAQAISRYESIVRNPEAASFHNFATYGIAWCLMQQDEYGKALSRLQPLLKQPSRDSIGHEARLAEGVCLRKLGQTEQAIESLETFLQSRPTGTSLANALYEAGLAYTEQRDLDKATKYFRRILAEVPDYPAIDKVLYELGWNYQEKSDAENSAKYFQQLAQRFPQSDFTAEATYMLAQQQYDSKRFGEAATMYTSILSRTRDPELLEKAQYKLGWSLFQQKQYRQAAEQFAKQSSAYPNGQLAVDALFMTAECSFKQDQFREAFTGYEKARAALEASDKTAASDQVKTLIYLHGAQCLREQKRWPECESWLQVVLSKYPESSYLPTALYEMGYCQQNQNKIKEALSYYAEVANNYRNEVAARSRFMMGEVYFSQRDFAKAIPEFQRVMYGFGGEKAPKEIQNWQAKSAYEAARCSEVLLENLRGAAREKVIDTAKDFYSFIVQKHAAHELAAQAQTRLGELQKLR